MPLAVHTFDPVFSPAVGSPGKLEYDWRMVREQKEPNEMIPANRPSRPMTYVFN